MANRGFIQKEEVKRLKVNAITGSGASMLCISDKVRNELGLSTIIKQASLLMDGEITELDIVGPVDIIIDNKSTSCRALVMPGKDQVLLGSIPMQEMDMWTDSME